MELPDIILAYVFAGFSIGLCFILLKSEVGSRSKEASDIIFARGILAGVFWPVAIVVGVLYLAWKIPQGVWWTIKTAMKRID